MSSIKDYAIIHTLASEYPDFCDRGSRLEKQVKDAIKDGWEPIGGLVIDANGNMYQSMSWCPPINVSQSARISMQELRASRL